MKKIIALIAVVMVAVGGWFIYLSQSSSNDDAQVPVITVMEILHASDLTDGIKTAVKQNDEAAITDWMAQARAVGEQAALSESDMQYLNSRQAREYVVFNARRALFNDAFEQRFLNLQDMGELKSQYPEARDLFPQAEALLDKRDDIIMRIAQTLAGGEPPTEQHIKDAQQRWRERYTKSQESPSQSAGPSDEPS
ncbi:hypothetical protein OCL06_04700 [Alteromonas sp. ASW11-19]|uniref:Uncharacterized protein n=1 Tax=Alteromonas salexigens TaxID=2982530 RepID=A0ABT2VM25_9ALTE|nr:hypothetical protein [Alteromonas salexigens]MCU7553892.1 hypothetical protein [Alteromonas salexigens]